MILSSEQINERLLDKMVGSPLSLSSNGFKPIGGPSLFLKSFISEIEQNKPLPVNSKCNFEQRKNGIIIHTNFSNNYNIILLPKKEIIEIKLFKGYEFIRPIPLSPFWILLKIGVPLRYARYLKMYYPKEYLIEEMKITMKTSLYEVNFTGSGYSYESKLSFLKNLNLGDRFQIITV